MEHVTLISLTPSPLKRLVEWHVEHAAKTDRVLRQCYVGMHVRNLVKAIAISLMPMNGMMGCVILTQGCFRVLFGPNRSYHVTPLFTQ